MTIILKVDLQEIKEVIAEYIRAKKGFSVTTDKIDEKYEHIDYDSCVFTGFEINLTDIKSLV